MRKLIASCSAMVVSLVIASTPTFAYTVKSGETLGEIANNNGMTLQQLAHANPQIKNLDLIYVGQNINLKKGYEIKHLPQSSNSSVKGSQTFIASAYDMGIKTATGTVPSQSRTIAVDPSIIPLGSKVEIESDYPGISGTYIAEDTGSAIKGNKIDIYMNTNTQCLKFGVRSVKIKILN